MIFVFNTLRHFDYSKFVFMLPGYSHSELAALKSSRPDAMAGWYRRWENNGWRPLTFHAPNFRDLQRDYIAERSVLKRECFQFLPFPVLPLIVFSGRQESRVASFKTRAQARRYQAKEAKETRVAAKTVCAFLPCTKTFSSMHQLDCGDCCAGTTWACSTQHLVNRSNIPNRRAAHRTPLQLTY